MFVLKASRKLTHHARLEVSAADPVGYLLGVAIVLHHDRLVACWRFCEEKPSILYPFFGYGWGMGVESLRRGSAEEVVRAFVSALERLDFDSAGALAAPDIQWINVPWKTATSKAGFEKMLRVMFRDTTRFEVQFLDIHERGDGVVYTDRIDIVEGGGLSMSLPVQGEFRVKNGLVTEWVDRFSWMKAFAEIGRSLPGIIRYRLGR
jgi:limonene-1,2-epoxide hydrolase